jgi:glucosyl-3-phosphoglycerate synthase
MVSVVIPTLNEEKRISEIVRFCLRSKLVNEVIVIDDGSTDDTFRVAKEAGAKVFFSSMLGKGASMQDGLAKSISDIILYLDGDIYNFSTDLIQIMVQPLIDGKCEFVKGRFHRKAGRVTALTAKPLLKAFFPEIATIEQPLGGIVAAKKELFKKLYFESDYGVDIGLLIDVSHQKAQIFEADIGSLDHDHQELSQLSEMSSQIVRVILERASRYNRLDILHLGDAFEVQRVSKLGFEPVLNKIDLKKKIALFDMDGTLIEGRYVDRLAEFANRKENLVGLIDNKKLNPVERTKSIAQALAGVPKAIFEQVASAIPLAQNAQNLVVELKKRGYAVGILTDSYFIASEIIRKRVFADFSIAHLLEFKQGLSTGHLEISPLMKSDTCQKHEYCKLNLLGHIGDHRDFDIARLHFAGDGPNDVCLLENIANSVAVRPKHISVLKASTMIVDDLYDILKKWK